MTDATTRASPSAAKRTQRYRSQEPESAAAPSKPSVMGLSMSYDHDTLLERGLGLEHLKELLVRVARELIRHGKHLAYGGTWREFEGNLTYELLRVISAERQDNAGFAATPEQSIGRLYCHSAWPTYLAVTAN